jgi:hypothetical protein
LKNEYQNIYFIFFFVKKSQIHKFAIKFLFLPSMLDILNAQQLDSGSANELRAGGQRVGEARVQQQGLRQLGGRDGGTVAGLEILDLGKQQERQHRTGEVVSR